MRFLLLAFLSVMVSCGQDSSSSKSRPGGNGGGHERTTNQPQNEEYVTDVRETDLLDVSMDVPVEITGSKIIFKESITDSENGIRSSCNLGVTSGEAYDYKVSGGNLTLKTSSGQRMSLKRVSGGNGIVGSWTGKTYNGRQLIMRRMTFVSESRLIMRTHCES